MIESTTPETALIGIALTDGRALDDVTGLSREDFHDERLGDVWALVQRLAQQNKPHTVAAVSAFGSIDSELLMDLEEMAPVGASAPFYAGLIAKQATRRRLIQTGERIKQLAGEADLDTMDDIVEIARGEVDAAGRVGAAAGVLAGDYFDEHMRSLEQPKRVLPTPWMDLNYLIGGWRPGALYVVGARPSVGKSVIGLQAALGMQETGTVLFATLEMSRDEVENRIIAQIATVHQGKLIGGQEPMSDQDYARIDQHAAELRSHRVQIDDRPGLTPSTIRSAARTISRRGHLTGIVVDYLQLMSSPKGERRPRHEVVAEYSRQLKLLAKELHVPVIALCQLNRNSTQGDRAPSIADLRESGAIEQDADVIVLLHQEDDHPETLLLRVGKNRHGSKGNFELRFQGQYARALDATRAYQA